MKKTKSPGLEAKENDFRSSNNSPLASVDGPRSPSHLFARLTSKALNPALVSKPIAKESSGKVAQALKAVKREGGSSQTLYWRPSELDKSRAQLQAFKRSFKTDKAENSLKGSLKVKDKIPSERPSTDHSTENQHPNQQVSGVSSRPTEPVDTRTQNFQKRKETTPTKPPFHHYASTANHSLNKSSRSKEPDCSYHSTDRSPVESRTFDPPVHLAEYMDKIERKYASLKQIFGGESRSLNKRQLSFFLSKLGWIGELDRNFEVRGEEDEQLLNLLFEGACMGEGNEATYGAVRYLFATIMAVFEQRLKPRCYETQERETERVLSPRMTPLSTKKTELGTKVAEVAADDSGKQTSIAKVQSCTSTPSQLSKYSAKFDLLTRPVIFQSTESDMQFSFRKASEQKLKQGVSELKERASLGLEYVDANHLNSAKKGDQESLRELDAHLLHSEEKPPGTTANHCQQESLTATDLKAHFDFGMSICESRVIESDAEAAIERNFHLQRRSADGRPQPVLVCELSIKVDSQCEILKLFVGDDLRQIARDFVRKWKVPDKELLVYEGLKDAYDTHLPKQTKAT